MNEIVYVLLVAGSLIPIGETESLPQSLLDLRNGIVERYHGQKFDSISECANEKRSMELELREAGIKYADENPTVNWMDTSHNFCVGE